MGYMLVVWAVVIGWQPFRESGDTFTQRQLVQIGLAVLLGIAGVIVTLKGDADDKDDV